jgi:hypothetical protein
MRRRVHDEPTTEPDLMRLTRVRSSHSFAFESDPRIALNTSDIQRLEQISRKKFSLLNLLEWIVLMTGVLGSLSWGTSSSGAAKPASHSIGRQ